jgi:hypothetical protein
MGEGRCADPDQHQSRKGRDQSVLPLRVRPPALPDPSEWLVRVAQDRVREAAVLPHPEGSRAGRGRVLRRPVGAHRRRDRHDPERAPGLLVRTTENASIPVADLERYSADATALVQPRMRLPGGTRQGTGWPPARNGAGMALAGEAMEMRWRWAMTERSASLGHEGRLVPISTGEQALDISWKRRLSVLYSALTLHP